MEEEGKMNYKDQCARINANYSIIAEYDMSHNKEILLGDKKKVIEFLRLCTNVIAAINNCSLKWKNSLMHI